MSDDEFRGEAWRRRHEFSRRPVDESVWHSFVEQPLLRHRRLQETRARTRGSPACSSASSTQHGTGRQPPLLPRRPAEQLSAGRRGPRQGRPHRPRTTASERLVARHRREAVRRRPRVRARAEPHASTPSSARRTSTASTTTSAKRPSRTSSSSASRTASSSRSGTASYVDHVQITVAESLGVGHRGGYYEASRRPARHGAEPHDAAPLARRDGAADRLQRTRRPQREGEGAAAPSAASRTRARSGCRRSAASTAAGWVGGEEVPGYRQEDDVASELRRRRPSSRCGCSSTAGAGPTCRSTCAPASACRSAAPRSRSTSSAAPHLLFRDIARRLDARPERPHDPHPAERGYLRSSS